MGDRTRFERLNDLFREARGLESGRIEAFIADRCADDPDLGDELRAMLAQGEETDARLEPVGDVGALRPSVTAPETIGGFRVSRVLGEGGMGVVYEAEQASPRRTVALKVVRPGLVSAGMLGRFRLEADVLARLQHPGIATIYESGTHETGDGVQPYFAMEFIDGVPLTAFAERERLGTRERLELLAEICDAVHHAHQRGVIHRDLKPANILVTGDGRPKVLDFGVARAVGDEARETVARTEQGQLVGTLPYMSPEQVSGDPDAVDTRSDVYSLGVVLFELLSGRRPYESGDAGAYELIKKIGEEEPTHLSSVDRSLRGDIDTIVHKAIEKDRERRYQAASELAAEIRRYLNDEPIEARPPSAIYQLRKFARRNTAFVASAGAVAAIVLAALVVLGVMLARTVRAERTASEALVDVEDAKEEAETQRDFARDEAARARQLNQLFIDMIHGVSPEVALGQDTTLLRTVLERTAHKIEDDLADQPAVRAGLHHVIGQALNNLTEFESAVGELENALALYEEHDAENPDRGRAMVQLAQSYYYVGRLDDARAMHDGSIERLSEQLGPDHPDTLNAINSYGSFLHALTKYEEAAGLWSDLRERQARVHGEDSEQVAMTLANLAITMIDLGNFAAAEPMAERALELTRELHGEESVRTLRAAYTMSVVYAETNRFDRALPIIEANVEHTERIYGPDHEETLKSLDILASTYAGLERYDDAEPIYKAAIERHVRMYGPDASNTLTMQNNYASMLTSLERFDEAEPILLDVLAGRRRTLPEGHIAILNSLFTVAELYRKQGRFHTALPLYEEAFVFAETQLPEGHFVRGIIGGGLGVTLDRLGRFEEAEERLLSSHAVLEAGVPPGHPYLLTSTRHIASLYKRWGKQEEHEAWLALLPEDDPARADPGPP